MNIQIWIIFCVCYVINSSSCWYFPSFHTIVWLKKNLAKPQICIEIWNLPSTRSKLAIVKILEVKKFIKKIIKQLVKKVIKNMSKKIVKKIRQKICQKNLSNNSSKKSSNNSSKKSSKEPQGTSKMLKAQIWTNLDRTGENLGS